MNLPLEPSWSDIAVRLALTLLAGAIIGFNRGARGHAAGFRTTILRIEGRSRMSKRQLENVLGIR